MGMYAEALASALRYHQSGDLNSAEQIYRQILQADPYDAEALHLLGEINYRYDRYETAIDHISRAIQLNPYAAAYHCNLAAAYQALGWHGEAIASAQLA